MILCTFALSTVMALAVPGGADLTISNRLTGAAEWERCQMNVDGVVIGITWHSFAGTIPDEITIIPPPGYAADPAQLSAPENTDLLVRVREIPVS